jgi:hypothetical protein
MTKRIALLIALTSLALPLMADSPQDQLEIFDMPDVEEPAGISFYQSQSANFFKVCLSSTTLVNTDQIDIYWSYSSKRFEIRRDANADWSWMFVSGNMNGSYFRTVTSNTPYYCPVMDDNGDMIEMHVGQPINNNGMWCDLWALYTNGCLTGHYILTPGS